MKCPICGREQTAELRCRVCGWDRSRDWERYPTAFSLSPAEGSSQFLLRRAAERRLLFSRLGDRLFSGLSDEELRDCLAGTDAGESAKRLLLRHAPEALRPPADDRWRNNFLCFDSRDGTLPASDIPRERIEFIRFLPHMDGLPADAWDASAEKNRSVMAYVRRESGLETLFLCGLGGVRSNLSCRGFFSGYRNLTAIDFGGCFHTYGCTDMSYMFEGCRSLKTLDLRSFDCVSALNFSSMFSDCVSLVSLELGNLRTDMAEDMSFMFSGCSALKALDLGAFETARVQNMGSMFSGCTALETLNIRRFKTAGVKNMSFMFFGCGSLLLVENGPGFTVSPGCTATGINSGMNPACRATYRSVALPPG